MSAKYAFIRGEEGNYPMGKMFTWAGVSKSGYYEWRDRPASASAARRAELAVLVRFFFDDSDSTYGYRRIAAALGRCGHPVDPQTVRSIMRELGLVACQPRRKGPATTPSADAEHLPDLVERDFTAAEPGLKLVGDITYIPTWEGWVFLAIVLDCFSKKIVGWAMAEHMRTELVTDALGMAVRNGNVRHGETIFHSDRGTQYTSQAFKDFCEPRGIRRSVGRTGICFDNAQSESWNGALKVERVDRTVYPTRKRATDDVAHWIELRYNQKRLHSALGYRTPNEVDQEWRVSRKAI